MRRAGSKTVGTWLDSTDHELTVPVVVQVFPGIERLIVPERLEVELRRARRSLEVDLGVPFPGLVMRPVAGLPQGAYVICIGEIPVQRGQLVERRSEQARVTPEHSLAQHVLVVLRQHADELIGIQETQLLLQRLANDSPDLEKELQRNVPVARLAEVLKRLVREDISIRNLPEIAHSLIEWAPREKDTTLLTGICAHSFVALYLTSIRACGRFAVRGSAASKPGGAAEAGRSPDLGRHGADAESRDQPADRREDSASVATIRRRAG